MRVHFAKALEAGNIDLHVGIAAAHFARDLVALLVGERNLGGFAARELIKGRNGRVDVALLNEGPHEAEEEREKKRSDMRAVDIGIGHDDDFVVTEFFEIKLVSNARAKRCNDRLKLIISVDLIGSRLFDVQHLAPEGKNCLEPRVTSLRGRAACGVTLDDVNFGERGICIVAVAEFIGHLAGLQTGFSPDGFLCLSGRLSGAVCHHGFIQNRTGNGRIFLKERRELIGDDGAYKRTHGCVSELGLRLTFKLRVRQLHGDDRGQALAHILTGNLVVSLDDTFFLAVGVEHRGKCPLEALFMHAAFGGMDVVGKGNDRLAKRVVILERDFRRLVSLLARHIDDGWMNRRFVPVVPLDEFADTAFIAHGIEAFLFGLIGRFDALVGNGDVKARVQEGLLAHSCMQRLVVVFRGVEHLRVWLEGDLCAVLVGRADDLHFLRNIAAGKLHLIDFSVAVHVNDEPFGKGVDNRRTNTMKTAGDLIAPTAEFAARVQNGIDDLQRGLSGLRLNVDGNAAAIV